MRIRKRRSFTLVELVMTIIILGVLAAVAIPQFFDLSGDAAEGNFKAMKGAFETALSVAHSQWVTDGEPSQINFNGVPINYNVAQGHLYYVPGVDHIPLPPAEYAQGRYAVAVWYALLHDPPEIDGTGASTENGWHGDWTAPHFVYSLFKNNVKLFSFSYNYLTGELE